MSLRNKDLDRPVSPVSDLPPAGPHSNAAAVHESDEAVQLPGPHTRQSSDYQTPAPLVASGERDRRFFLPLSSPIDDSGSSGDAGSVLALLATPEDRAIPPSPLSDISEPRPLPERDIVDPQAGTSLASESSVVSKASTSAGHRAHVAGKRPAMKARRSHNTQAAHVRPGLARKHSTGTNAGKASLAAGAIRRSLSTANVVSDTSILRALTAMPPPAAPSEKSKKRPPPVQTDASLPKVPAAPTSAKSPKGKAKVPPSPVVKAGARGKAVHGRKGKKLSGRGISRTKSVVADAEETDVSDTDDEKSDGVAAGDGNEDDEGWDDLTPEELAAQEAKEKELERQRIRQAKELERQRAREAEEERKRNFFQKRPKSEYEHLCRTKSLGLLSQLMKPDPNILPPGHPYRERFSSDNLAQMPQPQQVPQSQYRRTQSSLATQLRPMTGIQTSAQVQPQLLRTAAPRALTAMPARITADVAVAAARSPAISRTPSLAALGGAAPSLRITKSSAALPATAVLNVEVPASTVAGSSAMVAASKAKANIQDRRSSSTKQPQAPTSPRLEKKASPTPSGHSGNGYRPRGAPADIDYDTSDEESGSENHIQVAASVAQQKLAALGRRHTPKAPAPSPSSSHAAAPAPPNAALLKQLPTKPPRPRSEPQLQEPPPPSTRPSGVPSIASTSTLVGGTAPIPMGHPYNLPLAPPPTSPRTQRLRIVAEELTESLRHGLILEHKANRPAQPIRRQGVLGAAGALRPFTTMDRTRTPQEEEAYQAHRRRVHDNKDNYHAHGW